MEARGCPEASLDALGVPFGFLAPFWAPKSDFSWILVHIWDLLGEPSEHFLDPFSEFFCTCLRTLKSNVKEEKMVPKELQNTSKMSRNGELLAVLGFHENVCPSQPESWFLRFEGVRFRCIFGVKSGSVSEGISATI